MRTVRLWLRGTHVSDLQSEQTEIPVRKIHAAETRLIVILSFEIKFTIITLSITTKLQNYINERACKSFQDYYPVFVWYIMHKILYLPIWIIHV